MHEIHGPHMVDLLQHRQGLWFFTRKPFARLDRSIELQLLVDPIQTLVVPFKALDVTQIQVAQAKAPVAMVVGQSDQLIGHFVILSASLARVAIARLADALRQAGHPDTNALICDCLLGHLTSARWPHHFFTSVSDTISALSFSSRYISFNRRFYSSSSFMRDIMNTSMPPYLALHL